MKIAFLALKGCCDYERIGGAESFVRRLAQGITLAGNSCHYVLYGFDSTNERVVDKGITLQYVASFEEALSKLTEGYDHVIMIHISPRHRPAFFRFQRSRKQKKTRFHKLMLGTPGSTVEWFVFLAGALMLKKGGRIFTISTQTQKVLRRLKIASILLLPPVPEHYFVPAEQKHSDSSLTLTYIGRLDEEKGVGDVKQLFSRIEGFEGIHTQLHGYRWSDDRTTLTIEHHRDGQVSESIIDASESIYKPEMEEQIQAMLRDTDILVLPYHSMNGTIDPPLLVLEGMASSCAVLTCPVGNVAQIYGESPFVIRGSFVEDAFALISTLKHEPELLEREQTRVQNRVAELDFSSSSICNSFINQLSL